MWTGADNRGVRFRDLYLGQGAEMALPIWGNYMKQLYQDPGIDISTENFDIPENGGNITLDCQENEQISYEEEF
mgnify:FL=1